MNKITEYFQSVKKEMSKVSWPTQQELIDSTVIVVVFSIIVSLFIFGVDRIYSTVLELIFG
jgi:preprotein translocase subunit SecE